MPTNVQEDDSAVAVDAIRRELSLGTGIVRYSLGSVPVFAVGDGYVVKLFPQAQRSYFEIERAVLPHIENLLPIPTPGLIAAGEHGAWLYLVMTRLSGRCLAEAWPEIETGERAALVREVGEALAALHAIPAEEVASLAIDWPEFMAAQRASCRDRQLATHLTSPWVDAADGFLARWMPEDDGSRVLLHTEVMREHLLVDRREGAWHIGGLLDFEDALRGAREYEWACAGIFLTCGEPGLLGALLDGYGVRPDDELPMRCMAYALLHRYSNLRWYLERLPARGTEGDLESLARLWFAL
ncbi:MAG TPA: aminoglycoside 3'-phosphotransferase/choline kinase family protein [Candidatus Eisenbacteria bacterium]|nr:aminoglycoside 3'-phosphotransferase/choline kinase family protein [Candidatus Eisenbacteria bacterium]